MEKVNYSVLMSVYYKEEAAFLKQSIESMLNQTIITNDFVIIEDGKLPLELENIINEFALKYPEIFNVVKLEENIGLGPALAIGINNCKNDLIARMDSDDISIETRCEKQLMEFQKDYKLDIVGSNIGEFIENIDNIQAYRFLPENHNEIVEFAKRRNPFGHPSIMFKKRKVLEAGNYRSYYLVEDYDLWIRMIKKGARCFNIKEVLVFMRICKDFYKRRGGIRYLKSILKFKSEQYRNGFFKKTDYIISAGTSIIICLAPNFIREIFYKKILRKGK